MTEIVYKIENLTVKYDKNLVLDIPLLEIQKGEIFCIIGHNGSGKSTLLNILCLLAKSTTGELDIDNKKINLNKNKLFYRRQMAMVFQEPLLLDSTVYENVAIGLKLRKLPYQEINKRVNYWLDKLNITHLAKRYSHKLSGGEAQRVSLARALVLQPEYFFMDEPFGDLDAPSKETILYELRLLLKKENITTLFVTHDQSEALLLSDRIAVIRKGKILQIGSPYEVFNHPVNEDVANFVGMETILEGEVIRENGEDIGCIKVNGIKILASCDYSAGTKVIVGIRPEDVSILLQSLPEDKTSIRNAFLGTIEAIRPVGLHFKVILDCGFPLVAFITKQSMAFLKLEVGQKVFAVFKAMAIHIFPKS